MSEHADAADKTPKPRRRWRWARRVVAAVALLLGAYLLNVEMGGCARPVEGVWPPEAGQPRYKIVVTCGALHSDIGVWPADDPQGKRGEELRQYGFGDRLYFPGTERGVVSALRSLLLPNKASVRVITGPLPPVRMIDGTPTYRVWTFQLTREGHDRLMAFLRAEHDAERSAPGPTFAQWHPAHRSYHGLHNCHVWTARGLRAAGLPVWPSHALTRRGLVKQLDRAKEME